ncbi:nicastrin-like [Hydractinia symbiolongicarpus]|uniref:nicastrin-like n=1 Tax=Hydractinia symbiolongicarpus TaxID=13093 RepID=UPI0025518DF3|nr:nicastrin-like [Hydractinia symbiolongicarpus]
MAEELPLPMFSSQRSDFVRKILTFLYVFLFTTTDIFISKVESSKIDAKIYKTLNYYQPCVLLTNATHQVGCTSAMDGNRGVVHLINDEKDLNWMLNLGPHKPYIPILNRSMFTEPVMSKLMASKKISGALVLHINESESLSEGFSPDSTCPMDKFGIYGEHKEYGSCKKVTWNPLGSDMSMLYYGIPIFLLTNKDEIDALVKCYNTNNKPINSTAQTYPLCAVEMKDFMFGAKDTPTCRRKTDIFNLIGSTYCDPLADNNVYGTLYPLVGNIGNDDIVVAATRMDSTAFFHDFGPAADNGVTGIVTLLAAAKALGDYKRQLLATNRTDNLKPIMFTFFNGEVWDYIGSSRMVWDMERDNFPYPGNNPHDGNDVKVNDNVYTSKIKLSNIGYFIEIGQVGLGKDGKIFAHSDPISQNKSSVKDKVAAIIDALNVAAANASAPPPGVPKNQPLPPASFQRFLRSRAIPGVVLTDHEKEFANKYYNSRFDNSENLKINLQFEQNETLSTIIGRIKGALVKQLKSTSEALANTLYRLASNGKAPKENITVPINITANLLYCLLYSANCPAFKEILPKKSSPLPNQPYSRYISVNQIQNPVTQFINRLLAYYTGEELPEKECNGKTGNSFPKALSYTVMKGRGEYICVRASTYMTIAQSPAFEINDHDSTEYSTWAESMWSGEMGVQMFLVANPTSEVIVLVTGLVMLVLPFLLVLFCYKKSDVLFTPDIMIIRS